MNMTAADLVADARQRIREIAPADARLDDSAVLIDIREAAEFASGHLPGAINIPRGVLEFQIDAQPRVAGRAQPILIYCRSGGRAALAADSLQKLGFSDVQSIAGGIEAWRTAGLAIVAA